MKRIIIVLLSALLLGIFFFSFTLSEKIPNKEENNLSFMELQELHLPDTIERTVARGQYAFIGKYPNTTRYGVFHKKKEIAHFDLGEELIFTGSGGIVLGRESHRAFAIFYISSPEFKINIIELKLDNIDEIGHGSIEVGDLDELNAAKYTWTIGRYGPGIPILRTANKERYFAIPRKEAWADLLCVPDSDNIACEDFDMIEVDLVKSNVYR